MLLGAWQAGDIDRLSTSPSHLPPHTAVMGLLLWARRVEISIDSSSSRALQ